MKLYDICEEISNVIYGLTYGEINFSYDALMCAMKPGHPADILDNILGEFGFDVFAGKPVEKERLEHVAAELQSFKQTFKVKELNTPIRHLKAYIKEME